MNDIVLRRGTPEDIAAMAEIFVQARGGMAYLPPVGSSARIEKWMSECIFPAQEVSIAEQSGRIAGFASLNGNHLDHLYVSPVRQNCSVGSALLRRTKEQRPAGFDLYLFQKNVGARRFYERHGLKLVALSDGRHNEEREPDANYRWPGRAER